MGDKLISSSGSIGSVEELDNDEELYDCVIKLRVNPQRLREKVFIGCGAGFGERTLADRCRAMESGGDGYDSRISEWMHLLLPLAVERGTCIITNMGAIDPLGAQEKVLGIASSLGINITVGVAHQFAITKSGLDHHLRNDIMDSGSSTYLGAAPIVKCLEKYKPNVVITSRVADAALFLGPMVYELGWNWDELQLLAQGSLAGHLLECGCQLTGGYFMHPGDKYRDISFPCLLDLSLPFAEVSFDGKVCISKADGSGGVLNFSTCAEQLLYEVGDPGAYITPDVVIDLRDVSFRSLSSSKDCGWKGWGEISYGGYECVKRAKAAEFLVRSWMEEVYPGVNNHIISYMIGVDSLKAIGIDKSTVIVEDCTGYQKEITLEQGLVEREHVYWKIDAKRNKIMYSNNQKTGLKEVAMNTHPLYELVSPSVTQETTCNSCSEFLSPDIDLSPAPSGQKIPLYNVAHSRAGDKGNDLNFSIIPHFPPDIERLKMIITPDWVEIYEARGIHSLNVVVRNTSRWRCQLLSENRQAWKDHIRSHIVPAGGVASMNKWFGYYWKLIFLAFVRLTIRNYLYLSAHCSFGALYSTGGIKLFHPKNMSNYSSMDGVLYCKTHFEQLFKESGNFSKNFQTSARHERENSLTRAPSKLSSMFSGTLDKCSTCNKTVYPLEKVTMEGESYHKSCFKCAHGGCPLTHSSYAALDGFLYCRHHFAQLFMEKGNYSHVLEAATHRKSGVVPC
ncbi:hypothetical protein F0562_014863 [Nyssa sinensis]|uniref:LIM zinc-binding domain-containing protein n=1 Tax=Nyssa sinensis TaxID=561372 RepID=A0A5J4ZTW6_9ASTE|nr:hypothetical protein F0562_014863 [Nyssa sinensis]